MLTYEDLSHLGGACEGLFLTIASRSECESESYYNLISPMGCDYIVYKISVEYTKELQGP